MPIADTTEPEQLVSVGGDRRFTVKAVVVGLVAGFLSGLFGVGGGILLVPALVIVMGLNQKLAHGTSLAAVLPIAISSLFGYTIEDKVDWSAGAFLATGAIAGAVVGTHILHLVPERAVGLAFTLVLVATAVRLLVDHSEASGRAELSVIGAVVLVAVGLAAGILAGLLGVGGGIILVPAIVIGFGVPAAIAKGTSLAVIVPTSVMGTWRNRKRRNADLRLATLVGCSGVVSALAGSRVSIIMSDAVSNVLFAALLLVVAVRMLWQLMRRPVASPATAPPSPNTV